SGPGIHAGNANQLTPEVTQPGVYTLTVTSPEGCMTTDEVVVHLDPSAVVANAGEDAFISCDIEVVQLQASPIGASYTYLWTGPGINASNENLPDPVITEPGVYTLVVTDVVNQCASLPDTVVITDIRAQIIAIIQSPGSLDCYTTQLNLEASGSSTGANIVYYWFDEDGNVISNTPNTLVSSEGMFLLEVIDTLSGCFDRDSIFVKDLTAYPPAE